MYRYFLSAKLGSEKVEREVTKEEFCRAERQAGFRPKMPSDDHRYMMTPATGGFSGGGISGRMKLEPDKEDAPCEGCGIRDCGGGMHGRRAREKEEMIDLFMVFNVESIGLHGDGFAVAWVVVNRAGERIAEGCLACDPAHCDGTDESRLWISENVPPLEQTSPTKQHLRNTFWHEWRRWADQGAVLVADCAWPVEANFLSACVKLNHDEREWQGPYPLHDLASVLLALGADALAVTERLPDEIPAHHPLMDARQSARQLVQALKKPNLKLSGGA